MFFVHLLFCHYNGNLPSRWIKKLKIDAIYIIVSNIMSVRPCLYLSNISISSGKLLRSMQLQLGRPCKTRTEYLHEKSHKEWIFSDFDPRKFFHQPTLNPKLGTTIFPNLENNLLLKFICVYCVLALALDTYMLVTIHTLLIYSWPVCSVFFQSTSWEQLPSNRRNIFLHRLLASLNCAIGKSLG